MVPFAMLALEAVAQVGTPDSTLPTAIERALVGYRCSAMRPVGAPETDAYQECVNAQLLSLRTDFGRDLTRLSATERRRIDAICSKFSSATEREAYVECLNDQLVSLHNRRSRANPDVPAGAPLPPPSASTPSTSPAPLARASSRRLGLWIGGALVTVVGAASGVFLALRARRAPRKCKVCGQDVSDSGELCPACRREAAEVLRRAAAERADQQRAQEEEQRRQKEDEEERRRHKARQAEEARLRELEQAREAERARDEEEVRRPEQEAARATEQHQTDLTIGEVFDPYAILGVPRDASKEAIRAAYEEAKSKYDSDLVSSLGADVQEYFKAKAQAVERAYQQLTQ